MAIRFARACPRDRPAGGERGSEAGSPAIEAEHMLLAMTGQHGIEARDVLASAGLDQDAIRAALDREFRQSLAAAGVTLPRRRAAARPAATRTGGRAWRRQASWCWNGR